MRLVIVGALLVVLGVGMLINRRRLATNTEVDAQGGTIPADLRGSDRTWLVFSTPMCATCGPVETLLREHDTDATVTGIDATTRPDLVDLLEIRSAPTLIEADARGVILRRVSGPGPVTEFVRDPLPVPAAAALG